MHITDQNNREEKLRSIFSIAPVGIGIVSGRVIFEVNETLCRMTGYSKEEMTGRDSYFLYLSDEDYIHINDAKFEQIKKTGILSVETRWKRKDGEIIDIILNSTPLDMKDFSRGFTFTALDITDRKKTELALAASESKYRELMEMAVDGIMISDHDGYITEANSSAFDITGRNCNEVIGRHVSTFFLPENIARHPLQFNLLQEGGISITEREITRKDGSTGRIEIHSKMMPDGSYQAIFQDITERKKNEEALRLSEAMYKNLIELAVDGIMLGSGDDIITGVNTQLEMMTGRTREQLIGTKLAELFTDESIKKRPLRFDLIKKGETVITERILKRSDDAAVIVETHSKMMPDGTFQVIFHDITERKKNEEALRLSEARYKNLIELAVDGIMLGTEDGIITSINSQLEKMTGKTREQLIGTQMGELFTEESVKKCPLQFGLLKKGETVISERILKRDNGTEVIVETHSKMMPDGVYQSIFSDITERKRNEEALASEKERLAVTLRSIGDGVIAADTSGCILLMNRVAENLTGWKYKECKGRKLADIFRIVNEFTKIPEPDIINLIISKGEISGLSEHPLLISKTGKEIIISDSGAPIKDREGNITGIVIVFRDMTEKRKLAESMQRAQKLDSLATLAGGIAHDFNNMLGGILGYIDLARNYSKDSESIIQYLDKAMSVFDRAKKLTGQLMTFARGGEPSIKTGRLEPVLREQHVSALKGSDIKCLFNIAPDLWLCDFDSNQIGQVVYNIVTNAREFMGLEGEIHISAENAEIEEGNTGLIKPGRYVKVEITDSGKGIPADILPHIFDPFFTTKKKGNGLGLATSYSIIHHHKGFIDVESVPGKGAKLWFYLPATASSEKAVMSQAIVEHSGKGIILIMDDEFFIREIISQMLDHMGYRTIQAGDGNELINNYNICCSNPDLKCIILDLTIPGGMGGRETVEELRKLNRQIPVFASSGYSNDRIMSNPELFGFTGSIRKPFTMNELSVLLNRYLQ